MKIPFFTALISLIVSIIMAIYGFKSMTTLPLFIGVFCAIINTITIILIISLKKVNKNKKFTK